MFKSIVVGTDGSDTAEVAVRHAQRLAAQTGARVHLVSAYEPVHAQMAASGALVPEASAWSMQPDADVTAVLDQAASLLRANGVAVETHACRQDPAEAILQVADEEEADLVVIGNKGMRGPRRFLLGSVPNKVSHHAECTVMIVKTS